MGVTSLVPDILERPIDEGRPSYSGDHGWIVTVFDNPVNTFDEVIHILMVATACGFDEARFETWEIHNYGKCVVHNAEKEECDQVAAVISQIGIDVAVSKE